MHIYPRGSEWRKWDLHVHTPASGKDNRTGTLRKIATLKFIEYFVSWSIWS